MPTDADLMPCPFCGEEVMLRQALWPSDGDTDSVIHKSQTPRHCGMTDFSVGTADQCMTVTACWNQRATLTN